MLTPLVLQTIYDHADKDTRKVLKETYADEFEFRTKFESLFEDIQKITILQSHSFVVIQVNETKTIRITHYSDPVIQDEIQVVNTKANIDDYVISDHFKDSFMYELPIDEHPIQQEFRRECQQLLAETPVQSCETYKLFYVPYIGCNVNVRLNGVRAYLKSMSREENLLGYVYTTHDDHYVLYKPISATQLLHNIFPQVT